MFQDVPHPVLGLTPVAKSPFHFSTASAAIPFRAPLLGEHNEDILRDRLRYDDERIATLYRDGVIVQDGKGRELREAGKL